MRIAALHIYPVKSCAGVSLQSSAVTSYGLEHDREFMVVDAEDGAGLTQRQLPRLALIRPAIVPGCLVLAAPEMDDIDVTPSLRGNRLALSIHRRPCSGIDQGDAAAAWLTTFLGRRCRLARVDPTARRPIPGEPAGFAAAAFPDAFPFLAISDASLARLNDTLATPLPMNRFRPNIVLADASAHEEDELSLFRIGSIGFRGKLLCSRCEVTTVDQAMGIKIPGEPLASLAGYRRQLTGPTSRGVVFGAYLVHDRPGLLAVEMELEVLTRAPITAIRPAVE